MGVDVITALTGAGLGILTLLWQGIKFYTNRRDKKKTDDTRFDDRQREIGKLFSDMMYGAVTIHELIEDFAYEHDIARISVIKMENGGGIPQLGAIQTISVICEGIHPKYRHPIGKLRPMRSEFQGYTIGPEYQRMMLTVIREGKYASHPEDMEVGILRNILLGNDIKKLLVLPIAPIPSLTGEHLQGFYLYITMHFPDDREFDASLEADWTMLVNKIQMEFRDFYVIRSGNIFKNDK